MKKHLVRISLGTALLLAFLLHAAKWFELPLIQRLEAVVYDTRLALTMPRTVDPRIVILDIDEKSLAEKESGGEGHWPWPRDRMALLLDKLFDTYHINIIGFDIVFAERDESSGLKVLQQLAQHELKDVAGFPAALKQLQPQLDYDEIFARSLRNRAVVLGYTFNRDHATVKGKIPAPVLPAGTFTGKNINFFSFGGQTANLGELQSAAASAGHFTVEPDPDGILRRVPMLAEYKGAYYEPLSLAIVRMLIGMPAVVPGYPSEKIWSKNYSGLEWLEVGPIKIPVDEAVTALIPYRGKQRSYKYVSAVDVINDRIELADLRGKIVLVGATAPGLLDLRATPIETIYPGVEIHANMISGMLDRNIKQNPPYVIGAEFMSLLLAGLPMALLLPLLNPFRSLVVTVAVLFAVVATNIVVFFIYLNLVLPLASGLMLIALLFALNMSYGFFVEARGKNQITGLFGQYVPPELVDEMARNPAEFSMAPRAEELSVLFSDVRGFTTISEALSPEDLALYINDYLTTMSLVIREGHRGTLDKYIGDAIMAFWGAPVRDPSHARNALLASMNMQKAVKTLNEKFKAKGWPTLKIGVGVNSGLMRVGDMGSKIRRAYTVMGDAVNLASRLEGITKEYGADIIVGEGTRNAVPDIVFRELDRVRVKGKDESVAIFEPIGMQGEVAREKLDEIRLYAQYLRLYRAQEWEQAELQLINLQRMMPNSVLYSQTCMERISYLRANPPGRGWDGAFTFTTK